MTSLSACQGDSEQAAAACDSPGVTAREVRAGLLYPDSGLGADIFTPLRAGVDARFGAENAAGGVHGRRLAYEWRNDEARADVNLAISEKLVQSGQVFGIIEASVVTSGGAAYLAEAGVPVVGLAVEKTWTSYRNMFTFAYNFTGDGTVDTFGRYVRDQGGTNALVVYNALDTIVSISLAAQFTTSLEAVGATTTSLGIDNDPSPSQISTIVRRMRTEGYDTLVSTIGASGLAKVLAALRQEGITPKVVLSSSEAPSKELLAQHGSDLVGVTTFTSYLPLELESPATEAYRKAMSTYAPEIQDANQTLALVGYIIADIFVRGLQEAGECPTRQDFIDRLRAVKGYEAGGLLNAVDFEADFGKVEECYSFSQVNAAGDGFDVVSPNFCGNRL